MSEIFLNGAVGRPSNIPPPSRAPLGFHSRLPGYAPTPLLAAHDLAAELGVGQLWLKHEADRFGLPAFKILGASWAIRCLLKERLSIPDDAWSDLDQLRQSLASSPFVVASATDGNHGRGVARMARLLGLAARIYMPAGASAARIEAIKSEGATVVVRGTYDDAVARAAKETDGTGLLIQDTAWDGYEQIPGWIVEGYSTMLWEIDDALEQLHEPGPTHVFVQMGVGSLAEAVVRHYCRNGQSPLIIGIEPDQAACVMAAVKAGKIVHLPGHQHSLMAGLNCGTASSISFPILQAGMDCFLAIGDARAREAMRLLARHRIVAGETGVAGLAGLLHLLSSVLAEEDRTRLHLDHTSRILVILTEGPTDPDTYEDVVGKPPQNVS